jgi:hypothetical protein
MNPQGMHTAQARSDSLQQLLRVADGPSSWRKIGDVAGQHREEDRYAYQYEKRRCFSERLDRSKQMNDLLFGVDAVNVDRALFARRKNLQHGLFRGKDNRPSRDAWGR